MRPFFHSLLLSFRGIFYTLTGKNIAFANLQMRVVSKLWKFVTGFSIKIWLKFFGAVFLQPCFFAPKSFAVTAKRADPKRSALFLCPSSPVPAPCSKTALLLHPCYTTSTRILQPSCQRIAERPLPSRFT